MDNDIKQPTESEEKPSSKYSTGSLTPDNLPVETATKLQHLCNALSHPSYTVLGQSDYFARSTAISAAIENQQRWNSIIERIISIEQLVTKEYISKGVEALQRTFAFWEKYNYSIFDKLAKTLTQLQTHLHRIDETYQRILLNARWFPHAIHDADIELFESITEVVDTTREGSVNRIKRLDKAFFSFYDKKTLDKLKKHWKNNPDIPPHIKKIATQAINAYYRKEYALTISSLMTFWEGMIATKLGKEDNYRVSNQTRDNIAALNEENDVGDIVTQFCKECIFYDCGSPEQVIDDVPGRHAIAHAWYAKYPSRKTALNAILFTDFLFELNSKEPSKENNDG